MRAALVAAVVVVGCGDASLSSGGVGRGDAAGADARTSLEVGTRGDLGPDPSRIDAAPSAARDARGGGGSVADAVAEGDALGTNDAGAEADTGLRPPDAAAIPPTEPPAPCDPPNTVERDGRCIPSCGGAGGNTCVAAGDARCNGWPLLESHDCAVCCAIPVLPALRPNGFHTIVIADTDRWDSIRVLADADLGPILVSDNKPADLPFERWTRRISASREATGEALAGVLAAELSNPAGAPVKVVVDELREEYADKILAMTREMAARYPQWRGRWGVYIVNGPAVHYAGYSAQIDALLDAGAMILAEMYPQAADYCAAGPRVIDRDLWLARFFRGDENIARLHWLVNRKADRGSDSHLSVVFGVIDRFHAPVTPAVFLDRMFYVFVTRSDHRELIDPANGGPGAWKWQAPADGNDNVSNSSRDLVFAEAFDHYLVQGRNDSRLGPVDCP